MTPLANKIHTIMLRGATKTQTENTAQIHPTIVIRSGPSKNVKVVNIIVPNAAPFSRTSSLAVNFCKKIINDQISQS